MKTSIPHVSALDGARGLAVAGVLLFHGNHLTGGYLGVDFFFTLSGFLITSLLLAESDRTGNVGLGGFWARRARRLLPALAVLLVGVAIYSAVLAKPTELAQIRGDAFATLAYVANWREVFAHADYWAIFRAPSPLNHTWSLAIEEQFYVIWPLAFVGLLAACKRNAPKAVLVVSLLLATGSSILMIALYDPSNPNRVYFGTDTRAAAILLGAALAAALAIFGPATKRTSRVALEAFGIAGAVVLAIAWARLDGQSSTLYRGGFLLCALAATAIVAAAVHPEPGPLARALSLRPLRALGLISYGVYLYHWPIDIVIDRQRAHIGGWPLFSLQTTVTLAVAIASYRVVEQPIRRGALTSAQLRTLTPAAALGLALALVGATLGARTPVSTLSNAGNNPLTAAARAGRAAPPGSVRVLIVGNSVASLLAPAFSAVDTGAQLAVLDVSIEGCNFPPDLTDVQLRLPTGGVLPAPPCDPWWEAGVVERFRPQIVFWLMSDPFGTGGTYRGRHVLPCTELYATIYEKRLKQEVATLGAAGGRVVIPTEAYSRYLGTRRFDRATDCQNKVRRKVANETGARLVDLFGYICPNGQCRIEQDGVRLRPDGLHYEGPGGLIVAQWLINQANAQN